MRTALVELDLAHLWIVYPGDATYPLDENVTAVGLTDIQRLFEFSG